MQAEIRALSERVDELERCQRSLQFWAADLNAQVKELRAELACLLVKGGEKDVLPA